MRGHERGGSSASNSAPLVGGQVASAGEKEEEIKRAGEGGTRGRV